MVARVWRHFRGALRRMVVVSFDIVGQNLRAEVIERTSENMIAQAMTPAGRIKFYAPTPLLQMRAKTVLTKEPDMVRWIDGLDSHAVLWDIGANVGVFSLYAARKVGCRVLAFEPAAANFHVLARNVAINGLAGHISGYCVAMSGRTGLGVLNLTSTAMGAALSQFGEAGDKSRYMASTTLSQGMLGFTIDKFVELFDPPFPTHIKIDVDGLELAIVGGASRTLRDPRLRSVMLELSLSDSEERRAGMEMMESAGLRYVCHGEPQAVDDERAANHLFIR